MDREKAVRRAKLRKIWRKTTVRHVLLALGTAIVALLAGLFILLSAVFHGPSPAAASLLTSTLLETSAMKFVPRLYYTDAEIEAMLARNTIVEPTEEIDLSLIVIPTATEPPISDASAASSPGAEATPEPDADGLERIEISGATYKGYLLIVSDPARVSVGVCRAPFTQEAGLRLDDLADRYDAVAAINAGGFLDTNGQGNGGMPLGIVISEGKLLANNAVQEKYSTLIGFDQENRLVIGKLSAEQAKARGIRDAVSFGPALVINGNAAEIYGQSSGLNPRTAIGQRADGAVLLLVIDGRQVNSLGASYADLISVMLTYGAVNAANLDGGSSSLLYQDGQFINDGFIAIGPREIPTAFIVR